MEKQLNKEVTAEGTNASGDEIEAKPTGLVSATKTVSELVHKAREAMDKFAAYGQEQVNDVVRAVAWAIIKQDNAEELARVAVEDTGDRKSVV